MRLVAVVILFRVLPLTASWLLFRRRDGGWRTTTAVGGLLVVWMLGQFVAIGPAFPAMQLGFLGVGAVLVVLATGPPCEDRTGD